MKSFITGFILIIFIFKGFSQGEQSLNYFFNLAYVNPASQIEEEIQVDINSLSLFNELPVGILRANIAGFVQFKEKIGGSIQFQNERIGKASAFNTIKVLGNYTLLKDQNKKIALGLGFHSYTSVFDESNLNFDLDINSFTFLTGTERTQESAFGIPFGGEITTNNLKLGAYYEQGISLASSYGFYGRYKLIQTRIKELYTLKNFTGLAIARDPLNNRLTLSNQTLIDNYQIDFFAALDLTSSLESIANFGAAVYYKWKTFDINYQVAFNNNGLGLSHQLGLQLFLK